MSYCQCKWKFCGIQILRFINYVQIEKCYIFNFLHFYYIPEKVSAYHTLSDSAFTQHYYACRVSFVLKRSGDVYLSVCSKLEYKESHAYGASRTKLYITQEYIICCDCLLFRVMSIYEWRYIVFEKGRRNQ